jgi:hypothetical protein
MGRYPSPCPSQQARLGELATYGVRIRKRMRMGERGRLNNGCDLPPLPLGEGWGEG